METCGSEKYGSVLDAGDVEMYAGDEMGSHAAIEEAVHTITASGAIPVILGGDHSIALPDVRGVARHFGFGRISMRSAPRRRVT